MLNFMLSLFPLFVTCALMKLRRVNQIKSSVLLFEYRTLRSTTADTQDSAVYTMARKPSTTNGYRRRKVSKSVWAMASAVARAYNGGLGTEPPAGVQGAEPPVGVSGAKPPEAEAYASNGCNKFAPFAVFFGV